jgi:hypothetical protein
METNVYHSIVGGLFHAVDTKSDRIVSIYAVLFMAVGRVQEII